MQKFDVASFATALYSYQNFLNTQHVATAVTLSLPQYKQLAKWLHKVQVTQII